MNEIIKIVFIAIAGVFIANQFKGIKQEYSLILGVAIGLFIFLFCLSYLQELVKRLKDIQAYLGDYQSYFLLLLKALGIAYISQFGQAICMDGGQKLVAEQIAMLGKITIIIIGFPIVYSIIEQLKIMGG